MLLLTNINCFQLNTLALFASIELTGEVK